MTEGALSAEALLAWVAAKGTAAERAKLARYAIPDEAAVGIAVGVLRAKALSVGRDQARAEQLWDSGIYEARMLAAMTGEPAELTVEGMDCWCADFDSWAIVDAVCFHLFDRTPLAWGRVEGWAARELRSDKVQARVESRS